MYFDTHAHYDDEAFDIDRHELLTSLFAEKGIDYIVNPGCDRESSDMAMKFSEQYEGIYAAVGWHPQQAESFDFDESISYLRKALSLPKTVAIGEIGLDYYYDCAPQDLQRRVFRVQMELAKELNIPVIVHDREAHGDCMDILRDFPDVKGVFHCYSGSAEMARQLVNMGWYISFTGAVTFKNARKAPEVIEAVPLDRIMIETDCPYLAPVPFRGKRNDSSLLPYIAERIAEIKNIAPAEVAEATLINGKRFFGI